MAVLHIVSVFPQERDGGAHAVECAVMTGHVKDAAVGRLHAHLQRTRLGRFSAQGVFEHLHGHAAGGLAALVAAHAVGYAIDTFIHKQAVLIARTDQSLMSPVADAHRIVHSFVGQALFSRWRRRSWPHAPPMSEPISRRTVAEMCSPSSVFKNVCTAAWLAGMRWRSST